MNEKVYDFIILGAGISGLLLASHLSKKHSVLLIEKEGEVNHYKYWLTDKDSYDLNPDLKNCISSRYDYLDYIAYDYTKYRCYGEHILWDSKRLISYFMDSLRASNTTIIRPCKFYTYKLMDTSIEVFSNEKSYKGKLLIDCMGHSSPIVSAKRALSILGYYLLYGTIVKLKSEIDPVAFHNVALKSSPSYLEVFPKGDGYAYAALIIPEKNKIRFTSLKGEFDSIINQTNYREYIDSETDQQILGGIIPVGILKKKALDRIYFYGESGQVNPAATATGLTIMLKTYKEVSEYLSYMLLNNKLTGKELSSNVPEFYNKYLKRIQLHFFKDLIRWNSDQFLNLIKECNEVSLHDFVNGLIFGSINPIECINRHILKTLYNTDNKLFLRYILKSLFY